MNFKVGISEFASAVIADEHGCFWLDFCYRGEKVGIAFSGDEVEFFEGSGSYHAWNSTSDVADDVDVVGWVGWWVVRCQVKYWFPVPKTTIWLIKDVKLWPLLGTKSFVPWKPLSQILRWPYSRKCALIFSTLLKTIINKLGVWILRIHDLVPSIHQFEVLYF